MAKQTGFVYLAAPIDQAIGRTGWEGVRGAVVRTAAELAARGWGSYDPCRAFNIGQGQAVSREVSQINNWALGRCRGLVAFLPDGVPTIGVPIEIDRAAGMGKPVLILAQSRGAESWTLARYAAWDTVRIANTDVEHEAEDGTAWFVGAVAQAELIGRADPMPVAQVREPSPTEYKAILPQRAYDGDAGFDLFTSERREVEPGQVVDIPTNLAVELPPWSFGLVIGRSSALRRLGLYVHTGLIDSGYRGELFASVTAIKDPVIVSSGSRIAQLIVVSNGSQTIKPVMVDRLGESDRGTQGFGSSGT